MIDFESLSVDNIQQLESKDKMNKLQEQVNMSVLKSNLREQKRPRGRPPMAQKVPQPKQQEPDQEDMKKYESKRQAALRRISRYLTSPALRDDLAHLQPPRSSANLIELEEFEKTIEQTLGSQNAGVLLKTGYAMLISAIDPVIVGMGNGKLGKADDYIISNIDKFDREFVELECKYSDYLSMGPELRLVTGTLKMYAECQKRYQHQMDYLQREMMNNPEQWRPDEQQPQQHEQQHAPPQPPVQIKLERQEPPRAPPVPEEPKKRGRPKKVTTAV